MTCLGVRFFKVRSTVLYPTFNTRAVSLTPELRKKAAESFRALSWAFYQGSK